MPCRTLFSAAFCLALLGCATAVDFKQYKTCTACIDAGYGWCPIRRICGGFANTQCGDGEKYFTEDYGRELLKKEKGKGKKKGAKKAPDALLPDVVPLARDNFTSSAVRSEAMWIVSFCTPWSDSCKSFAEEWSQAAKSLRGAVRFGSVDADAEVDLTAEYDVTGYPAVVSFIASKDPAEKAKPWKHYTGGNTAPALINFAQAELREVLLQRGAEAGVELNLPTPPAAGKKEEEKEQKQQQEAVAEGTEAVAAEAEGSAPVAEGSAGGAEAEEEAKAEAAKKAKKKGKKKKKKKKKKAKKAKSAHKPGTGDYVERVGVDQISGLFSKAYVTVVHAYDLESAACSEVAEQVDLAATSMRGLALFGGINAVKHASLPHGMQAGGVYLFRPGATSPEQLPSAGLTADVLTGAANEATPAISEVKQLTEQKVFDACISRDVCIVAFLPHLLDGGAESRHNQLKTLADAAGSIRVLGDVLWVEAGSQIPFESAFDVLAHPTVVVLNKDLERGAALPCLDGAITAEQVIELAISQEAISTPYKKLRIDATAPWDGSEFAYPQ